MSTPIEHPLGLPAPSEADAGTRELKVDSEGIKLDALGPMVVNSDGTLSRIANWANMADAEKQRTLRVLGARNQLSA
ncbi:hypothetical protein K435DRAFT_653545 [Dendrothele bispora CBS 962.96]|uniref:Uncharacterized protein n=1 Tax=Dendrothele bispora (strain CBS 962.96) TaxID=1314807 RepID=A0A4S8MIX0_DENBC|nr:hypothetical protein K435DRAFT_653545 [Dendrothele bispora CBS 962.96]